MRLCFLIFTFSCFIFTGCKTTHKISSSDVHFIPDYSPGPHVLIYKTRKDYQDLVPVTLSVDKTTIVSYPDPIDIRSFSRPTLLHDSYHLDNRGIHKNTAFLKLTYEEYAALQNPLSLKEMLELIIDTEPLTELCDCGNKKAFTDIAGELNNLIDSKKLRTVCRVIK